MSKVPAAKLALNLLNSLFRIFFFFLFRFFFFLPPKKSDLESRLCQTATGRFAFMFKFLKKEMYRQMYIDETSAKPFKSFVPGQNYLILLRSGK